MDGCIQCLGEEFRSENAGLGYDDPVAFVTSQWPVTPKFYVIYRALIAVAVTGWCFADVSFETTAFYDGHIWKWFIYATNWSLMLLALSAVYLAITATIYIVKPYWIIDPLYPRSMPICLRLQWIIYNLSCNSAFIVAMSYWAFIAFFSPPDLMLTPMSHLKHTMNFIYVIIDVIITGIPMRVLHMFMTITLGSVYALFNAIYFLNDGTVSDDGYVEKHYAYNFMNWRKPVEAVITCVLCVLQAMFSQVVLNFLYRIRMCIYSKFFYNGQEHLDSEMQNIIMSGSTSYNAVDEKSICSDGRMEE